MSLFEELGGRAAVDAAVEDFYARVMADGRINHFFAGTDMKKQRAKQKMFLTYAFGGAPAYSGDSMRRAHERLVKEQGLNDEHFDIVVGHLGATLKDLGVADPLIARAAEVAESVRDDVLNR